MSKKKMTPAEVAEQLGQFISKQEETLSRYPVGPLGNTARRNLEKGRKALKALQGKNEEMRMQMDPNAQAPSPQMVVGGETVPASKSGFEVGLRQYNPGALESGKGELGKLADERFATFATLEDGWNALTRQLSRYQKGLTPGTSGDMTLSEAMGKYAPKYENDTAGYITKITSGTGANPNTPIKDIDINKWATAVSRVESPQAFVALENAGLLDSEAASVYTNDALVRQARQSGAAEKFTTSVPQIDANRDTTAYSDIFNAPVTQNAATSSSPVQEAPSAPESQGPISDELDDDKLFELAASDLRTRKFMERNNVSTQDLMKALDGDYVDIPNRAAFDGLLRKVASDYNSVRDKEIAKSAPSTKQDQTGDSIGWSESTGISRERYKELLSEAEDEFPDEALAYIPGPNGTEGAFSANIAAPNTMGQAVVETEIPRDAQGRPDFPGMQAKINYDNFKAGGEDFQSRGMDMTDAVKEGRDQFAKTYLQPALYTGLGAAGTLPGALGLSGLGAGLSSSPTMQALGTVGGQFLRGMAGNPFAAGQLTGAGALGAGVTSAELTSGILRGTGDFGMTDRQNAYEVAIDPDLSNMQKAEYFTMLGLEVAPVLFNSPTAIRNLLRGQPSDFIGSRSQFIDYKKGILSKADDAAELADKTADTFRATQTNRQAFKNTAASAEKKAVAAEAKAVSKPTAANKKAATAAREKATKAKANDTAALRNQQADQARRGNAAGRSGVANEELDVFNKRYNAAREPYQYGLALANTGDRVPNVGAPASLAYNLANIGNTPELTASQDPRAVQVQLNPAEANTLLEPPMAAPDALPGRSLGNVLPTKELQVPDQPIINPDTAEIVNAPGSDIQAGSPDMMQVNMPKMNALQAVPAMASLGSAAIQRRALNSMQGPQRPNETAIPQFAYESNIQSQLDNIRNATGTAARGTNLPGQAAAANQQALMAARFRAEGQARALDNRDRQQAKARYDALAYQGRSAQNALRDSYQNDMTAFNNQKAMLDAQIKQQPLNVLASSTQDYLKNIYAPNLAAMIEAQGRQYGTTYNQDSE